VRDDIVYDEVYKFLEATLFVANNKYYVGFDIPFFSINSCLRLYQTQPYEIIQGNCASHVVFSIFLLYIFCFHYNSLFLLYIFLAKASLVNVDDFIAISQSNEYYILLNITDLAGCQRAEGITLCRRPLPLRSRNTERFYY
jgi:hypothetical protein